jgi:hypothetical protein
MAIFEAPSLLACRIHHFVKPAPFTPSSRPYVQRRSDRGYSVNLVEPSMDEDLLIWVMSVRPILEKLLELLPLCDIHRA